MSQVTPEEISFWAKVAGALATGFTALFGVWRHTHKRIDSAFALIDSKASVEEMNRQRDNIATLFRQQREDRDAIMAELGRTNEILGGIHLGLTRELEKRPSREEMREEIDRSLGLSKGAA